MQSVLAVYDRGHLRINTSVLLPIRLKWPQKLRRL